MKRLLILCGIFAALVYVGTVILGGLLRPGYSHLAEAISELVAAGAPDRSLLSSLFLTYNVLTSAFGIGLILRVKDETGGTISGHIGSLALVLVGISGISMELAFPQDAGGTPTTFAGTMHFVMAGIASLGTMVALLFLTFWFRHVPDLKAYVPYSLISISVIVVSGGLTAAAMTNHYPLFGLIERITIGTFILWLFVIGRRVFHLEGKFLDQMHLEAAGLISQGK